MMRDFSLWLGARDQRCPQRPLTSNDHQSVSIFALRKLEEFARASEDFRELERRAQRGSREKFQAAMAKVPNVPTVPEDDF